METTCGSLLRELEDIWREMGEREEDRHQMLLELERECLQVYQKKVDECSKSRAQLRHSLAVKEAELSALMASLGEHNLQLQMGEKPAPLKKQLALVSPLLEELRVKKDERVKQFANVLSEIKKLQMEMAGYSTRNGANASSLNMEEHEHDLSLRKFNECQVQLRALQKEKSDRLQKVIEYVSEVHLLCGLLGLDFGKIIKEVHPSLHETDSKQSTNISDFTLHGLAQLTLKFRTERDVRVKKLKETMESLVKLWSLMDSSEEERKPFERLTCILRPLDQDATVSGVLSLETIEQAEAEVERLTRLKTSRMKQIVLKRRSELEALCAEAHLEPDMSTSLEKCYALIDSGLVDASELMTNIEAQIQKVNDEARSRREVMNKINKWLTARDEEDWLEEYNQDQSRYTAVRGSHLNLKRAEKARVAINKIPAMVDILITKAFDWEDEHNVPFLYDGIRLVSILEEYKLNRLNKEEEKRRLRDLKKLQSMLLVEKESMYGSKPSPKRRNSFNKRTDGYQANENNGFMTPMPCRNSSGDGTPELLTPRSCTFQKNSYFKETRRLSTTRLNFVTLSKADTSSSSASLYGSELGFSFQGQLQL